MSVGRSWESPTGERPDSDNVGVIEGTILTLAIRSVASEIKVTLGRARAIEATI